MKGRMDKAEYLQALPKVFYRLDMDGSGSIDVDEMRQAMQEFGVACTDVELASMFIDADVDGDGTIDFAEFRRLMSNVFSGSQGSLPHLFPAPSNRWLHIYHMRAAYQIMIFACCSKHENLPSEQFCVCTGNWHGSVTHLLS